MMVSIHQPQYLPWLGYVDKIERADVFIILDNVQYKKNEWQNRNRIKTASGWQWITVPVLYNFPEKINEVRINNKVEWRRKHRNAIETNYKKAPFFTEYFPYIEKLYEREWERLVDINIVFLKTVVGLLGVNTRMVNASEIETRDDPTVRLIDLCRSVGADTYLSGREGPNYMDMNAFKKAGIDVVVQDFEHPVYQQMYEGFEPNLSCIDLLFNCGNKSMEIIKKARVFT